MAYPAPVYMGQLPAVLHGDITDFYLDIDGDLDSTEAVSDTTFVVTDTAGVTVSSVVSGAVLTGNRVDFRVTAPATPGVYTISCDFTINDGQSITRTATLYVV